MNHIKVMIADDHQMFISSLVNLLQEIGVNVIDTASNGEELLKKIRLKTPDVVLLDIRMPVMNGEETLKVLVRDFPQIKIIILSSEHSDYYISEMLLNGAHAYIIKGDNIEELVEAIKEVYENGFYFNSNISQNLLNLLNSPSKSFIIIDDVKFSTRELEILRELCNDNKPKFIASKLNISTATVNFHKRNLLEKTNSPGIISLVKYAIRVGIAKNDCFPKPK